MWISNIELDQRITKLEKRIIQNVDPLKWEYKWQLYFNEVSGSFKYWDWKQWVDCSCTTAARKISVEWKLEYMFDYLWYASYDGSVNNVLASFTSWIFKTNIYVHEIYNTSQTYAWIQIFKNDILVSDSWLIILWWTDITRNYKLDFIFTWTKRIVLTIWWSVKHTYNDADVNNSWSYWVNYFRWPTFWTSDRWHKITNFTMKAYNLALVYTEDIYSDLFSGVDPSYRIETRPEFISYWLPWVQLRSTWFDDLWEKTKITSIVTYDF